MLAQTVLHRSHGVARDTHFLHSGYVDTVAKQEGPSPSTLPPTDSKVIVMRRVMISAHGRGRVVGASKLVEVVEGGIAMEVHFLQKPVGSGAADNSGAVLLPGGDSLHDQCIVCAWASGESYRALDTTTAATSEAHSAVARALAHPLPDTAMPASEQGREAPLHSGAFRAATFQREASIRAGVTRLRFCSKSTPCAWR